MNGMQIWEVNGIDDLEGTVFAQCSTKEKAEKAMKLLEKEGFEGMLVVEQSGLRFSIQKRKLKNMQKHMTMY